MNMKKYFTTLLISTAGLLVIVMLLGGLYVYFGNIGGGFEFEELDRTKPNGVKNVLVLGTDKSGLLSDVIMLFSLNQKNDTINLVSVPRDTKVSVNGKNMKITEVYGLGGEKLSIQKIKEIVGVPIHDYIIFNFTAVEDIVNALGGIDFYVPQNMYYTDPEQGLYINLKKGQQILNGDKAIQLLRFRGYAMADIQRNAVQQDFIKAVFEQKATMSYFVKIPEIYGIVNENIVSSMSLSDITKYASALGKMENPKFESFEMPYTISNPYVLVKNPEARELFDTYFNDNEE